MSNDLLLVGSIPYDTAEQVFRAVGPALGPHLPFIPDGEIGERIYWINQLAYRVFHGHPDIETIERPIDEHGVEAWRSLQLGTNSRWIFKVKAGVKQVKFGDPGWRLGYARDAINSYFVFKTLRDQGVIPAGVRFQVSIPLTASAIRLFFPDAEDYPLIRDGFTESLHHEVTKIFENIPHEDLAIQWDCAIEDTVIEKALTEAGGVTPEVQKIVDDLFAPAREVSAHIPAEVQLGYHACYGTATGWPVREPADLTGCVLLCNAGVAASGRRVDFLHMPTVAGTTEAYVAPLADLETGGARVYMGLIHALHEDGGMRRQMELIKTHIPDFGVAAPCGFGRGPAKMSAQTGLATPNDYMDGLIADQIAAVELLCEVLGS
ncbi:MAG: hypothetical protein HOO19_11030 [Rhodospirillaceae bacterium]|nr:hypothetical protein [Rhodospirillaceae bacterium]MBT4116658.1 hypothetical protein [Rhodospirillaceae bacterium]MBT4749856.1 hypothetical protein [Rhodospirillaceae bacterium]MBT5180036.1 hypothetical protein [Rhodospirillaceae bacterium]MBT5837891.1 hypothetical protein [Rhodospirillaceae bacterium]